MTIFAPSGDKGCPSFVPLFFHSILSFFPVPFVLHPPPSRRIHFNAHPSCPSFLLHLPFLLQGVLLIVPARPTRHFPFFTPRKTDHHNGTASTLSPSQHGAHCLLPLPHKDINLRIILYSTLKSIGYEIRDQGTHQQRTKLTLGSDFI